MTLTPARPTRRTLVRSAAWGNGNIKHVSWDLTLTNGAVAIQSISITFTYIPASGGGFEIFEIYSYAATTGPRDTTWSAPNITGKVTTATSSHGGINANTTTLIHTDFEGDDNAAGTVSAVATITYVDIPGSVTKTITAVTWDSGDVHSHPA